MGLMRRFALVVFGLRGFAGLPLAVGRLFIALPLWLREAIVSSQGASRKWPLRVRLANGYAANSSSSAFASFRSRVSKPSVNQP